MSGGNSPNSKVSEPLLRKLIKPIKSPYLYYFDIEILDLVGFNRAKMKDRSHSNGPQCDFPAVEHIVQT
jgi:hypothetical protein